MCSAASVALLLLALGTATARGQGLEHESTGPDTLTPERRLAALRAHAESVAAEWRRARAIADLVDSLDRAHIAAATDTIRVGALTIITNPSPLPLRAAAARAWPVIDSLYGSVAQSLAREPYLIVAVDPDTAVARPPLRGGIVVPWDVGVPALTALLVATVPVAQPDRALERWLNGWVRPLDSGARPPAAVYRELVTAPSTAARRCLLGDLAGCRDALDVADSDEVVWRWYATPPERRAAVGRAVPEWATRQRERETVRACLGGADAACVAALRALPQVSVPRPLNSVARATLVDLALRLGGREAYRRLLASPAASVSSRLVAAAGSPMDSLVGRWRREIIASRPAPVELPPWGFGMALGWVGVFLWCGVRSSRWRVQ